MGFPITTYTVLDSIALGGEDPHFRKLISPFNLFAFILGSPRNDPKLFATIDSAFDRLAFASGEKLLFFALARPSSGRWGGERSNVYERLVKFQPPSIGPDHEAALASALALGMGITESALPCIVATTDLKSKDFVWFGTSAASLEEQLWSLGYLAWQQNRWQVKDALLAEQINFDPERPSGLVSLDTSVAQAIADVLSFPVYRAQYRAHGSDVEKATERARQTLGGIFSSIKEQKSKSATFPDDDPDPLLLEKLESDALKGLSCLSLLTDRPDLTLIPEATDFLEPMVTRSSTLPMTGIRERRSHGLTQQMSLPRWLFIRHLGKELGKALEAESIQMLKTALLVQDLFESQPQAVNALLGNQLDYTPTVICLAKVFEKEANLSVVHWIRDHLRISLPPYFNQYQPEIQAVFTPNVPNPHAIDFNRERNGIWIAPAMGQSELACRELGRTSLPHGWSQHRWSRLMRGWHLIRVGRNAATHTELINEDSALRLVEAMDKLAEHRIFESMCALKMKYRGF